MLAINPELKTYPLRTEMQTIGLVAVEGIAQRQVLDSVWLYSLHKDILDRPSWEQPLGSGPLTVTYLLKDSQLLQAIQLVFD